MVRRYIPALAVLGVFFVVAARSSQAGWGQHSGSSHPGESMSSESSSKSTSPASEESTGAYEDPKESGVESSEYQVEEPVETGRLPESEGSESNVTFGDVDADPRWKESGGE